MTKKTKSSLLLLFLVQLFFAQESEWHWQNPYPLPFIHEIHQGIDDWLIVQHASGDMYQINDDGTFTELDMNLPPFNFVNGPGNFKLITKQKWILFVPYAIYITEDGGKSYEIYTSDIYWQYGRSQFIDDLHGIANRIHGDTKQVVKTVDGGKTWEVIYSGEFPQDIDMVSKDTIYYLSYGSDKKIVRTIDGGTTWEEIGSCKNCDYIQKVGNNLLIEDDPKVYLSEDEGKTLKEVLFTWDENVSMQGNSKVSVRGNVLIKSNNKILFKSIDSGYTWEKYDMNYRDLDLFRGFFKDNNNYYNIYRGYQHRGIMKLDVDKMEMNPILGEPITHLQSIKRMKSGILASPSYDEVNAQIRIFTSEDDGYTWNRQQLKLPDGNLYVDNAMQLNIDSSMYILLNNTLYFYKSFIGDYTSKVELDSIIYSFDRFDLNIDDDGKGILIGHSLDHIYYTKDYFQNYEKIPLTDYKYYSSWRRSDGKHWLFGRKIDNNTEGVICLLDENEMDTCYHLEAFSLFNLLGDDLIVGNRETYPSGMKFSETEETVFCPALPGFVLSIISEERMIMKNQELLYLANPLTCEVIENADIDYLIFPWEKKYKWDDFRFIEMENEDILGYSYGGYLIRRTDNFLDTLLYNTSKEVEYETPAQEHQFLVYPNPTSDWLQVKDMPYGVECRIIDMTGREYMHGKQSLIYTGQYPSGTYIIQFFQDGRWIESQKIVIQ